MTQLSQADGRRAFELLIEGSTRCDRERADKLFKVDRAVLVDVEHVEHIL
jgi:hypothetical protein